MRGYSPEMVDEQLLTLAKVYKISHIAIGYLYGIYIAHGLHINKPISLIDFEQKLPFIIEDLRRTRNDNKNL